MACRKASHSFYYVVYMRSKIFAIICIVALVCESIGNDQCGKEPLKADVTKSGLQLAVTKLLDGKVVTWKVSEKEEIGRQLNIESINFQAVEEGAGLLEANPELRQVCDNLTGGHLLLTVLDSRKKIRYQTIAVEQLTDAAKRAIKEALRRQGEVEVLELQIDAAEGAKRIELIVKLIGVATPMEFALHYPKLLSEISSHTGEATEAVRQSLKEVQQLDERANKANRLHFELSMVLRALPAGAGDAERIVAIDNFITQKNLEPEMKQLMVMRKYLVWSGAKQYDKALAALEEARLVLPGSDLAGRIPGFVESVRKRMSQQPAETKEAPAPVPSSPETPPK
jgi:hypothetical protein